MHTKAGTFFLNDFLNSVIRNYITLKIHEQAFETNFMELAFPQTFS